ELKAALGSEYAFQTGSDCEVINALYGEEEPASFLNRLNGIFDFALWDVVRGRAMVARDPKGLLPLYLGLDRVPMNFTVNDMNACVIMIAYIMTRCNY